MGKEIHTQVQESQNPTQDKSKEKHANTQIINLMKIKHKDKNTKSSKAKGNYSIPWDPHKAHS